MRRRTSLWLFGSLFTFAGCTAVPSGPVAESPPLTDESALRAGTTYGGSGDNKTTSPVKHLIVIIGENRTFDHVFATYKPKNGQTVDNLLSKGIVNEDGTPGPNFNLALQVTAIDANPGAHGQLARRGAAHHLSGRPGRQDALLDTAAARTRRPRSALSGRPADGRGG